MINPEFFSCPIIFIFQLCKLIGGIYTSLSSTPWLRKAVPWFPEMQVENKAGPRAETRIGASPDPIMPLAPRRGK